MTPEELIASARAHLKTIDRSSDAPINLLPRARFREAAVIYFGSDARSDYVEVVVDRETGEFIQSAYFPEK